MNLALEDLPGTLAGPVLLLADNPTIAAGAPAWARAFAAAGLTYRVRLIEDDREASVAAAIAEAASLRAATILAVGGGGPRSVGRAVAERLGLPLAELAS